MKRKFPSVSTSARPLINITVVAVLLSVPLSASAIQIVFDYSYDSSGFFSDILRRDILQTAGDTLGARLSDNLLAITSGPSGSGFDNNFTAQFSDPASAGPSQSIDSYSVIEDTMVVFVGGYDLGGSTLGLGGPGGYGVSGTADFLNLVSTRGQAGAPDTDFGPWGGSISFNDTSSWYFDTDLSTSADIIGTDFYSVALHEIGHVLGLGTSLSWDNLIDGSNNLVGPSVGSVALDPSAGHFADGTGSFIGGVSQEAAMTPSVLTGTRKEFTDLDYAALSDIGWQVSAVPVPAAAWLFGSGLLGLIAVARRRT